MHLHYGGRGCLGFIWKLREDLRRMKSRVLTLAIISAIIQHPKYIAMLLLPRHLSYSLFSIRFAFNLKFQCSMDVSFSLPRDQFVAFVCCHIVVLLTKSSLRQVLD